jgi:hypothetical protein
MRWGIFWKSLQFDVGQVGSITSCSGLVHNFNADDRQEEDVLDITNFSATKLEEHDTNNHHQQQQLEQAYAIVTDNNEPKPPGRQSAMNLQPREYGFRMRDSLCHSLDMSRMKRPSLPGFRYNDCWMIYMVYSQTFATTDNSNQLFSLHHHW